jgi:hypothetical protein
VRDIECFQVCNVKSLLKGICKTAILIEANSELHFPHMMEKMPMLLGIVHEEVSQRSQ